MSWWSNLTGAVVKDEHWLLQEVAKGWQLLKNVGHTAEVDIVGIHQWIIDHQTQIDALFKTALEAVAIGGAVAPPPFKAAAAAATIALDASQAAIDKLSASVIDGTTPLSLAVTTYQAVKATQTAV